MVYCLSLLCQVRPISTYNPGWLTKNTKQVLHYYFSPYVSKHLFLEAISQVYTGNWPRNFLLCPCSSTTQQSILADSDSQWWPGAPGKGRPWWPWTQTFAWNFSLGESHQIHLCLAGFHGKNYWFGHARVTKVAELIHIYSFDQDILKHFEFKLYLLEFYYS